MEFVGLKILNETNSLVEDGFEPEFVSEAVDSAILEARKAEEEAE